MFFKDCDVVLQKLVMYFELDVLWFLPFPFILPGVMLLLHRQSPRDSKKKLKLPT